MNSRYSIDKIFISRTGFFDEKLNEFIPFPTYDFPYDIVVEAQDGYYRRFNKLGSKLRCYKQCNESEKNNSILWGDLIPLWPYLTKIERETGLIFSQRVWDIFFEINGVTIKQVEEKEKKQGNILTFKPKIR